MRFSFLALWLLVLSGCGSSGGDTTSSALNRSSSAGTNSSTASSLGSEGAAPLSSLTFDDPVFAQCVMRSGVETVAELNNLKCDYETLITYITDYDYITLKITSIKGIEQLISLETLLLTGTELIEADLSSNQALTEVIVSDPKLNQINVNGLASLETLIVARGEIQALDLSQNPNLQELTIDGIPLSQIELSNLKDLRKLHLRGTLISDIDFSGVTGIIALDISSSPIGQLNPEHLKSLEEFTLGADDKIFKRMSRINEEGKTVIISSTDVALDKLKSLSIRGGEFKAINLSAATSLESFRLDGSVIENFDLMFTPNLKALTLWGLYNQKPSALTINGICNLNQLNLEHVDVEALNLTPCKNLRILELLDGRNVGALDLSELNHLEELWLRGNDLSALSLPTSDSFQTFGLTDDQLPLVSLKNSPALTDVNIDLPISKDHQIELGDIRKIEYLVVDGGALSNTSPYNFSNLTQLYISGSDLGNLDLSLSSNLEEIYISNYDQGALDTLRLPANGALRQLYVKADDLKTLHIDKLEQLESVSLRLSADSEIDLTQATSMTSLELDGFSSVYLPITAPLRDLSIFNGTGISQLDLSEYLALESLLVTGSDVTHIDLSNNHRMQYVEVNNTALEKILLPIQSDSAELSVRIEGDRNIDILNIAPLTSLVLQTGPETDIDLSNTYRLKVLSVWNIGKIILPPDNGLELLAIEGSDFEKIDISDYPKLETLSLHSTGLKSVEINNSRLKQIALSGLELEHIHLGNLPLLKELNIFDSGSSEVDLSGTANITDLRLSGIAFKSEQLENMRLLEYLDLKDLPIASLTLPNDGKLKRVNIHDGDLEALKIGQQLSLTHLFIALPKLTNIDLNGSSNLKTLRLYNSLLTDLDLPENHFLTDLTLSGNQLNSLNLGGLNNLESVQIFGESIPCENIIYDGDIPINCVRM